MHFKFSVQKPLGVYSNLLKHIFICWGKNFTVKMTSILDVNAHLYRANQEGKKYISLFFFSVSEVDDCST